MKLVLFDIDGTLLRSDGAGRRAIHRALIEVFGTTGPHDYFFDGKTDPQIVRELMRMAGHGDERIDADMQRLFARYLECLREELVSPAHRAPYALPGVPELLDALEAKSNVILGLLTGNLEPGARAKIEAVGLEFSRFRVGAFGSDHEHRREGSELRVEENLPKGVTPPDLPEEPQLTAPGIDPAMVQEFAKRLSR